jgi:hypothetical protein
MLRLHIYLWPIVIASISLVVVGYLFASSEDQGEQPTEQGWRSTLSSDFKDGVASGHSALESRDLSETIPPKVIAEIASPIVIDAKRYTEFGEGKSASLLIVPLALHKSKHPMPELIDITSNIQVVKVPDYVYQALRTHSKNLSRQKALVVDARTSTSPLGITVRWLEDGEWRHFTGIAPYEIVEVAGWIKDEDVRTHYAELNLVNAIMGIVSGSASSSTVYEMYNDRFMESVAGRRYWKLFRYRADLERHEKGLTVELLKKELKKSKYDPDVKSTVFDKLPATQDQPPATQEAK